MRASASLQHKDGRARVRARRTQLGSAWWSRHRRKLEVVREGEREGVTAGVEPSKEQEYSVRRYKTKHILFLLLILVELFSNTEGM